jgi:hypothetical protein
VTSNVEASYDMMDLNSVESIDDFIEQIIGNLIPIIYQKYPYLKDSLLLIYKACEEFLVLLKEDNKSSGNDYDLGARATYAVFRNLPRFSKRFEKFFAKRSNQMWLSSNEKDNGTLGHLCSVQVCVPKTMQQFVRMQQGWQLLSTSFH